MSSEKRCCVPNCNTTSQDHIPLHKFPNPVKDHDRFLTWTFNIGGNVLVLGEELVYKLRRVCRKHFDVKYHATNRTLLWNAIPTLLTSAVLIGGATKRTLPDTTKHPSTNHAKPSSSKGSGNDNVQLHSFPNPLKERERFLAWTRAIGSTVDTLDHNFVHVNRKVCRDHFETKYLTWTQRISYDAIPTLLLPECEVSIPMMDITNVPATTPECEVSIPMMDITNVPATTPVDVKSEADALALCSGCLSSDRSLSPITGDTLYTTLLDSAQHTDQYCVSLCWECRALLRRVRQFRVQIQRAHHTLTQYEKGLHQEGITTLSRLTTTPVLQLSEADDEASDAINLDNTPQGSQTDKSSNTQQDSNPPNTEGVYADAFQLECSPPDHEDDFQMTSDVITSDDSQDSQTEELRKNKKHSEYSRNSPTSSTIKKRTFKKRHKLFDTIYVEVLEPIEDMSPYCTEVRVERSKCEAYEKEVWGKPFQCKMCFYGFDSQTDLKDHLEFKCFRRKYQIDWDLCLICQEREDERRVPLSAATDDNWREFQRSFEIRDRLCDILHMRMFNLLRDDLSSVVADQVKWHETCFGWFTSPEHIQRAEARFTAARHTLDTRASPPTPGTYYKCVLCNYTSASRRAQEAHLKSAHATLLRCPQCRRLQEDKASARVHFMRYHKLVTCEVCGLRCFKSQMIRHLRDHPPSVCRACNIEFTTHKELCSHNKSVHPPDEAADEENFCVECNKQFKSKVAFKIHLKSRLHAPERALWQYACTDCEQVFHNAFFLRMHRTRTHRDVDKHSCSVCHKKFTYLSYLKRHFKNVHEKREKPRDKMCVVCGKGFHTKPTLVNHMRTHTGERPFQCELCPARFTQRAAAVTHMRLVHKRASNGDDV